MQHITITSTKAIVESPSIVLARASQKLTDAIAVLAEAELELVKQAKTLSEIQIVATNAVDLSNRLASKAAKLSEKASAATALASVAKQPHFIEYVAHAYAHEALSKSVGAITDEDDDQADEALLLANFLTYVAPEIEPLLHSQGKLPSRNVQTVAQAAADTLKELSGIEFDFAGFANSIVTYVNQLDSQAAKAADAARRAVVKAQAAADTKNGLIAELAIAESAFKSAESKVTKATRIKSQASKECEKAKATTDIGANKYQKAKAKARIAADTADSKYQKAKAKAEQSLAIAVTPKDIRSARSADRHARIRYVNDAEAAAKRAVQRKSASKTQAQKARTRAINARNAAENIKLIAADHLSISPADKTNFDKRITKALATVERLERLAGEAEQRAEHFAVSAEEAKAAVKNAKKAMEPFRASDAAEASADFAEYLAERTAQDKTKYAKK